MTDRYLKQHIIFFAAILFLFLLLFSGCGKSANMDAGDTLLVQYFYFNLCSSCDPEAEFLEKFEELAGISAKTPGLKIEMYNTYKKEGLSEWQKTAEELGAPDAEPAFPVLRIGRQLKYQWEIQSSLSEGFSSSLPEKDKAIPAYSSVALFFYAPGCHGCEKAEDEILSALASQIMIGGRESPVHIIYLSIADPEGVDLFRTYCSEYYVGEDEQKVPMVFVGYRAFSGFDEITGLPDALMEGEGLETPVFETAEPRKGSLESYTWLGVFVTGLINGLNPCSVSMMLMLLSLLAMEKKKVLLTGTAFVAGKFLGFFILGTAFYSILSSIDFKKLSAVFKITFLVFSGILIILNLNDIIASKSGRYQKIKLQLPEALRKYNHRWINKIAVKDSSKFFFGGGLVLGMVLSAGEFLCTGQMYLAVILHSVHSGLQPSGRAASYLILYSIAFTIPLLSVVLLVFWGKRVFDIGNKFRENMVWVKLGNMIIFLVFFVVVLFVY